MAKKNDVKPKTIPMGPQKDAIIMAFRAKEVGGDFYNDSGEKITQPYYVKYAKTVADVRALTDGELEQLIHQLSSFRSIVGQMKELMGSV